MPRHSATRRNQKSGKMTYDQAARLFGPDTRDILVTGIYLQHMARDAGIDAPLDSLRKFADLIRADAKSEGIGSERVVFEHLPTRLPEPPRPIST